MCLPVSFLQETALIKWFISLSSDQLTVIALGHDDAVRNNWNRFVSDNAGTYYHLYEWRSVFENSYHLTTHYLAVVDGDEWLAILPLAVMPTPFRAKAVSLPYSNYGGLLLKRALDYPAVIKSVTSYLASVGINQVEMRCLNAPGSVENSSELTMILTFPASVEALWKAIGDKARNQVRKAEKAGLVAEWGAHQVAELYDIYADNMGRLGTPVHARAFIEQILQSLGDKADVLTIRLNGQAIAAMLLVKHGDLWADPIASSRVEFRHLNPNMLLYWEALRQAMASGARQFDFGRSQRDSGTHKFKKQWGAEEVSLDYHTVACGERVSVASTNLYRGGKAAMFAKIWSHLPNMLQRLVGPKIRRYIP